MEEADKKYSAIPDILMEFTNLFEKYTPKSDSFGSFPESLKLKFLNYPPTGKHLLSAIRFEWKALSGFPVKLENFRGKLSIGKLSPIVCW